MGVPASPAIGKPEIFAEKPILRLASAPKVLLMNNSGVACCHLVSDRARMRLLNSVIRRGGLMKPALSIPVGTKGETIIEVGKEMTVAFYADDMPEVYGT